MASSSKAENKSANVYDNKDVTEHYRERRTKYPAEIFDRIGKFCEENRVGLDLALDIACGSGQAAEPLAGIFKKVIGVDGSGFQIAKAPRDLENLSYMVADCNKPFNFAETGTVDLINIATALHWLDKGKFPTTYAKSTHTATSLLELWKTVHVYALHKKENPDMDERLHELFKEWQDGNKDKSFVMRVPYYQIICQKPHAD
ncbi:putative methyltransferase DDB_G0268948 [Aplysia californica]|uniref:Methyltransferase DDB_G0268948 n=1 Tax=Aplysia californica TaxID=6500 RepID=A0ABM0JU95_APLCA|nr:putative methyltransferase DDB_G0268948 [Aplysia californica]